MKYTVKLKCRQPFNNWEETHPLDCEPITLGHKIRQVANSLPYCDIIVTDPEGRVCCTVRVKAIGFNLFRRREMTLNGNRSYMEASL